MVDELAELKERIAQLPDEELLRMVTSEAANYRQEALAYAEEELRRRGISFLRESPPTESPFQAEHRPRRSETEADAKYRGVGGWLLLFCVGLTILTPLFNIVKFALSYSEFSHYFNAFPGLLNMVLLDALLSVGVMILSVHAGISLWAVKPNAVRTAKSFLLVYLCYSLIAVILPLLAGLPPEANKAIGQEIPKNLARAVVYVSVWFTYLSVSKRVKATYVDESAE